MGAKHERTHAEIVRHASRLFRERGTSEVGVDDVMAAAGLTRGGFYAHFDSKESLLAEAVARGFVEARENLIDGGDCVSGPDWVESATKKYVADAHVKARGRGCVVAALASEISRTDGPARDALEAGVVDMIAQIQKRMGARSRKEAVALFSQWVGSLLLARAVRDEALSREILAATRNEIQAGNTQSVYTSLPAQAGQKSGTRRKLTTRRTQRRSQSKR